MLMAVVLGLGICASAYLLYKNKTAVSLKILDLSLKMEEYYLKIRGNVKYYLIPDNKMNTYKVSYNFNDIFVQDNDILLQQAYNINDRPCQFYIQTVDINKKIYNFIKSLSDTTEKEINENIIKFKSPILSCTLDVMKDNEYIYKEYDITENMNSFINYDTDILLSNDQEYKKMWIYYFNYIYAPKNAYINYNNLDQIKLSWNIMTDKMEIISGSNIKINIDNNNFMINKEN